MTFTLIEADCIVAMASMDEASVDAIVTDPPYGLHFMGKTWDKFGSGIGRDHKTTRERSGSMHAGEYDFRRNHDFQEQMTVFGVQALRVLKPGGHLLAFGGTRTYHRLACALEDAGFEIRDTLCWLYGSGFPKSLDVSKAIDKAAGAEREITGPKADPRYRYASDKGYDRFSERGKGYDDGTTLGKWDDQGLSNTAPATPEAERWQGWGTALKPAFEPVVLARKPLIGTVAQNVQTFGTGALNIDGTRIEGEKPLRNGEGGPEGIFGLGSRSPDGVGFGRWPANVLLDEEAAALLDEQSGELMSQGGRGPGSILRREMTSRGLPGGGLGQGGNGPELREPDGFTHAYGDRGGASRFFYVAKADREERNRGLGHREAQPRYKAGGVGGTGGWRDVEKAINAPPDRNHHPTVKPVELMQWLCRLITPPKGTVLDPFTGSGSTGMAALREGFTFIGIEREPEYVEIARDRILGDAPLFNVESVTYG